VIRFIESIQFNPAFAKAVYDMFYDSENENLDFNGLRYEMMTKIDGWPKGLDMENFEMVSIGRDYIVFVSGGDWQEMIPVTLRLGKNTKFIWSPFEPYTENSRTEIKCACQDLINYVKVMNEDCQIAGAMTGSLPPNAGSISSLMYKNRKNSP